MKWDFIAFTFDSDNVIIEYLNGDKILQVDSNWPILYLPDNNKLTFGICPWLNTNHRIGYWLIDEVRIYNRALSDSEIRTLYNATK
jgi:hypothetical protein